MSAPIRVTIWNEYRQDRDWPEILAVYPEGIHKVIGNALGAQEDIRVRYATLDDAEHGLTQAVLDDTDVLIWWGHIAHGEVSDHVVQRVCDRVTLEGMGVIFLHASHASKPFKKLCGTHSNRLKWREDGARERIWVIEPAHPIARGIPECIVLDQEEMYGEPFDIPAPDELVFLSWFKGGEVFRSGFVLRRGLGKCFYFRPGHESFPTYYNPHIQRVILNGVRYVNARDTLGEMPQVAFGHMETAPEP